MKTAAEYIEMLDLQIHPEGGYFREIYRSPLPISAGQLPSAFNGTRDLATSIYFLLNQHQKSRFHRLESDELWYFHCGSPVRIYCITPYGNLDIVHLGIELQNRELPQIIIPKNTWFAAEIMDKSSFTLMGCMVAPGFDFQDFTLADQETLLSQFPHHAEIICRFT